MRGIPEDIVAGGQGRAGTELSVRARQTFWVAAVGAAALLIVTSFPPQTPVGPVGGGSVSFVHLATAPVPDAQRMSGRGHILESE